MFAERLDRRVRLDRRTAVVDESGQPLERWDEVAEVWAAYKPGAASEGPGQRQTVASEEATFTIRWRRDATPLHRLRFEGHEWDVLGVVEIGRREGLEIRARARAEAPRP